MNEDKRRIAKPIKTRDTEKRKVNWFFLISNKVKIMKTCIRVLIDMACQMGLGFRFLQ